MIIQPRYIEYNIRISIYIYIHTKIEWYYFFFHFGLSKQVESLIYGDKCFYISKPPLPRPRRGRPRLHNPLYPSALYYGSDGLYTVANKWIFAFFVIRPGFVWNRSQYFSTHNVRSELRDENIYIIIYYYIYIPTGRIIYRFLDDILLFFAFCLYIYIHTYNTLLWPLYNTLFSIFVIPVERAFSATHGDFFYFTIITFNPIKLLSLIV